MLRRVVLIAIIGSLFFSVSLAQGELPYGSKRTEEEIQYLLEEEIVFYPQDLSSMLELARKEEERYATEGKRTEEYTRERIIKLLEGLEEEVKKYPEKIVKKFVARYDCSQEKYQIEIKFQDGTSLMHEGPISDYSYGIDALKNYTRIAQQRIGISLSSYSKKNYSSAYRGEGRTSIRFKIIVFNHTDRDIFFTFITNQRFEVIIEDEDGEEVWRFSQGKHFWIYPRGRFDVERIPAKGERIYAIAILSFRRGNFKIRAKYLSQEPLEEAETRIVVLYAPPYPH